MAKVSASSPKPSRDNTQEPPQTSPRSRLRGLPPELDVVEPSSDDDAKTQLLEEEKRDRKNIEKSHTKQHSSASTTANAQLAGDQQAHKTCGWRCLLLVSLICLSLFGAIFSCYSNDVNMLLQDLGPRFSALWKAENALHFENAQRVAEVPQESFVQREAEALDAAPPQPDVGEQDVRIDDALDFF
ncbi:unnamed protein product, partial [Amoebophrya sp. A25]|eukprot:GSA25T00023104001.1